VLRSLTQAGQGGCRLHPHLPTLPRLHASMHASPTHPTCYLSSLFYGFRIQISKLFRGWQILVMCELIGCVAFGRHDQRPSGSQLTSTLTITRAAGVMVCVLAHVDLGDNFPTRGPPLCDATQSQETQPGAGATLARRHPLLSQLETWIQNSERQCVFTKQNDSRCTSKFRGC
jgi:hypothetical protein